MTRALGRVGMLVAPALVFAAPAAANHVQCGDVITTDTTLDSDLVCAGDGLTFEGDVTLDLSGHTIQGSGAGLAVSSFNGDIEVRDGIVRGFGGAINADGPDALLVYDTL